MYGERIDEFLRNAARCAVGMAMAGLAGCTFSGAEPPRTSLKDTPEVAGWSSHVAKTERPRTTPAKIGARGAAEPAVAIQAGKQPTHPAAAASDVVELKKLIEDPRLAWMEKIPSAADYAKGTRLFAYKALAPKLTCSQLNTALHETHWAGDTFARPMPTVTAGDAKRIVALNTDVQAQIATEIRTRCASAPKS